MQLFRLMCKYKNLFVNVADDVALYEGQLVRLLGRVVVTSLEKKQKHFCFTEKKLRFQNFWLFTEKKFSELKICIFDGNKPRFQTFHKSVWNPNKKFGFRTHSNQKRAWEANFLFRFQTLFANRTVIECLKSILVWISDTYSIIFTNISDVITFQQLWKL